VSQEKPEIISAELVENLQEAAGNILIVDDEYFIRDALQIYFETKGFSVLTTENGEKALEIFARSGGKVDVVVLDLMLPGIHGIELLKLFKANDPSVEVIIVTGCGTMGTAIEALRHGAFDYITKPIVNFDEDILKVVQEAINNRRQLLHRPEKERTGVENGAGEKLKILENLVELGAVANQYRQSEAVLEKIEDNLSKNFSMQAGIVLQRVQSGQFIPVYSWGFSCPLFAQSDHLPDSEVFIAVEEGFLGFFPVSSLDAGWLGIPTSDLAGCHKMACLPLAVQGKVWGSLIVLFSSPFNPEFNVPTESHPYQALAPILSLIFSGSLRTLG